MCPGSRGGRKPAGGSGPSVAPAVPSDQRSPRHGARLLCGKPDSGRRLSLPAHSPFLRMLAELWRVSQSGSVSKPSAHGDSLVPCLLWRRYLLVPPGLKALRRNRLLHSYSPEPGPSHQ